MLGVEGTFSATGLKKTIANLNQFPPVASQAVTTEIQSLFTATARLGFLAMPQWLLYIKGGYAGVRDRDVRNHDAARNTA